VIKGKAEAAEGLTPWRMIGHSYTRKYVPGNQCVVEGKAEVAEGLTPLRSPRHPKTRRKCTEEKYVAEGGGQGGSPL